MLIPKQCAHNNIPFHCQSCRIFNEIVKKIVLQSEFPLITRNFRFFFNQEGFKHHHLIAMELA